MPCGWLAKWNRIGHDASWWTRYGEVRDDGGSITLHRSVFDVANLDSSSSPFSIEMTVIKCHLMRCHINMWAKCTNKANLLSSKSFSCFILQATKLVMNHQVSSSTNFTLKCWSIAKLRWILASHKISPLRLAQVEQRSPHYEIARLQQVPKSDKAECSSKALEEINSVLWTVHNHL